MSQCSEIKSHPDLLLTDHLAQVSEVAFNLLKTKYVHFPRLRLSRAHLEGLVRRAAMFHDLGKATAFFEKRLTTGEKGSNGEHQHTGLSAILAFRPLTDYCRENNLAEVVGLAPLMAILLHHSEFRKELPYDSVMDARLAAFKKAILSCPDIKNLGFPVLAPLPDPIEIDCAFEDLYSDLLLLPDNEKAELRLLTLFVYSLLLEADKAYLAVNDRTLYQRKAISIDSDIVDKYKAKTFRDRNGAGAHINLDREKAYTEVVGGLDTLNLDTHIYTLTLPTGMGKTLLAASWAIKLRNKIKIERGFSPQIIVALPFLSITDQSAKEYENFLGSPDEELFLKSHSLSPFNFNGYEANTAEYFINIWKSQIIMTTFDQLLFSFLSFKPKHLMRFHNLLNSIIIMDEIQSLPPHLWHPVSTFLTYITDTGIAYLLLMSATQPKLIEDAKELVPTTLEGDKFKGAERYFEKLSRYQLLLKHKDIRDLQSFLDEMAMRLPTMPYDKIMIVLNTRDSAKEAYKHLKPVSGNRDTFFLSSYVIPAERLERIKQVKASKRVLVVTTQCIEAGVDIDMDYVIRDFGPLDSIVQVAGRCNREGQKPIGTVEIVKLYDPQAKGSFCPSGQFSAMVYDPIALDATSKILDESENNKIPENRIFQLTAKYFGELHRKDLGKSRTQCLLDFSHKYRKRGIEHQFDIRKELRGNLKQYSLIVGKNDPDLRHDIEKASEESTERWERRRKLKALSARIASSSISINAFKFDPNMIATKGRGDFYFMDPQYYDGEIGFDYDSPKGVFIV